MTDTPEGVRERIRRCLALSHSPNQNEAIAALTKARALMAKYKVEVSDAETQDPVAEGRTIEDFSFSKRRDWWAERLAYVICPHYGCRYLLRRKHRCRTYRLHVFGRHDDMEGCIEALRFAHGAVYANIRHYSRDDAYSYGCGFADGLRSAYDAQDAEHPEYALVMMTPDEVERAAEAMSTGPLSDNGLPSAHRGTAYDDGYRDGVGHLRHKIEEAGA